MFGPPAPATTASPFVPTGAPASGPTRTAGSSGEHRAPAGIADADVAMAAATALPLPSAANRQFVAPPDASSRAATSAPAPSPDALAAVSRLEQLQAPTLPVPRLVTAPGPQPGGSLASRSAAAAAPPPLHLAATRDMAPSAPAGAVGTGGGVGGGGFSPILFGLLMLAASAACGQLSSALIRRRALDLSVHLVLVVERPG
jgi:hypothetical protein